MPKACVEYFPMRNRELLIFAHMLYKGHHLTDRAKALGAVNPDTQRLFHRLGVYDSGLLAPFFLLQTVGDNCCYFRFPAYFR